MRRRPTTLVLASSLASLLALGPLVIAHVAATDVIVVQQGDTLSDLALRHGTTVERLAAINRIRDPNLIIPGQRLLLDTPVPSAASVGIAPVPSVAAAGSLLRHVVRPGEHLTGIARRYGTTVAAVAAANGLADPSFILAGTTLLIPVAAASPSTASPADGVTTAAAAAEAAPATVTHAIVAGDTLTALARRYGTTIAAIAAANGLADPSRIFAGMQLAIPVAGPAGSTAASSSPTLPASIAGLVADRESIRQLIVAEAQRYGVPAALALAVAWQESGWQQQVVSSAGAVGVMQVMPATGAWVGEAMLGESVDLSDTRSNVRVGVRLIAYYLDYYRGDKARALAAYYQGQRAVDHYGIYRVTYAYLAAVLRLEELFG